MVLIGFVFFSLGLSAHGNPKAKLKKACVHQNMKIKKGVANGTITKRERKVIKLKQRDVKRTVRRAKADGNVTPKEKVIIKRKNKKVNKSIKIARRN